MTGWNNDCSVYTFDGGYSHPVDWSRQYGYVIDGKHVHGYEVILNVGCPCGWKIDEKTLLETHKRFLDMIATAHVESCNVPRTLAVAASGESAINKVAADIAAGRIRVERHTDDDIANSIRYAMDALKRSSGSGWVTVSPGQTRWELLGTVTMEPGEDFTAAMERAERDGLARRVSPPTSAATMLPTCHTCCIPGATAATGRCSHGYLYRSKVREERPAPQFYDGITAEQCLELFCRIQRDDGVTAMAITPKQMAAARELWSAQLRARVSAAKEVERCVVTYSECDADD